MNWDDERDDRWDEDGLDDEPMDEAWDEADGPWDDDEVETVPCPACGADVYEEAEQCPVCGEYVTFERRPLAGWSAGWILLAMAGVVATVVALVVSR